MNIIKDIDIKGSSGKGDINVGTRVINKRTTISIGCVAVICIGIVFFFIFNSSSIEDKIVGTWQLSGTEAQFEFTKDKKFIYLSGNNGGVTMTYSIDDDNRIQLNLSVLWANSIIFADVDISGKTMTLTNFISPDNLVKEEKLEFVKIG